MSDEQTPPPPALRLKPRLRPADGQAPAAIPMPGEPPPFVPVKPAESAPSAAEAAATPDATPTPKIRFKPRLSEGPAAPGDPNAAPAPPADPPAVIPAVTPPSAMENPRVTAPAPPLFVTPPPPVAAPLFVSEPAPTSASVPPPPAAAPAGDAAKFKLKPKSPSPVPPPPTSAGGPPPPVFAPPPGAAVSPVFAPPPPSAPVAAMAPPPVAPKAPPPFPVMAPSSPPKPPPVVAPPHEAAAAAAIEPAVSAPDPRRSAARGSPIVKLAALLLLMVGTYFAWQRFKPEPAAPPPAQKATVTKTVTPAPAGPAPLTPSETLNQLAHAPANAINKAQEAIAARRASGQARIDAASIGEDLPDAPTAVPSGAPGRQPAATSRPTAPATTTTTIAPGVTATTQLEAAAEASPAFRSFVANAKVSGVFQGSPSRAVINGRLTRIGEAVDSALGITFEGVDHQRRYLIFKDKSGATVSRRF